MEPFELASVSGQVAFPRRIALTNRNVAWDLAEIEEWIEARKSSGTQAMRPGFTSPVAATAF
uniref:helix-turn-helix transcriptional regulator n=1 Tax=Brachymonas wangyanguii TaxID=3130163 RepID=UPI003F4E032E